MRLKKDKDEDREENCLHIGSYKKKRLVMVSRFQIILKYIIKFIFVFCYVA